MVTFANSVDPDETARNIRIHTVCHSFCYWLLTETPIYNNGYVQIQRWKSPFQKLRYERVKHALSRITDSIYLIFSYLFIIACFAYVALICSAKSDVPQHQHAREP